MRTILVLTVLVSAIGLAPYPVSAHSFKVALVATVSGPMAGPGKQARDGFMLATTERDGHPDQESDGHLGGLDVYVTLIDPRHSPASARASVRNLIGKTGIDFVIVAGNQKSLAAIHPLVTGSRIFLIATTPSPPALAGAKCNPFFFSLSWARDRGGDPPGAGNKFKPGESGRPFAAQWANDLDNPANKAFVAAFEKAYGYPPTRHAAMGYEAARLIASAVRARGDTLSDRPALRAALRRADFRSIRGGFKFDTNQFPIQDHTLVRATRRADGAPISRSVRKLGSMRGDRYAANCTMK